MNQAAVHEQTPLEKNAKRVWAFIPLYLAVPLFFWLVFQGGGSAMQWSAFGLGALGWVVALMLRGPVSAISIKWPKAGKIIMISASGPLEEGVRYAALAVTAVSYDWALSLGQGWAAVEVLFTVVNVIAIAKLAGRTDEKAMQAKELLKAQGTADASPFWGVIERISASAFHIGATLCIAAIPWSVFLLIPVHSLFNLAMVRLAPRSIALAELFAAVIGGALLAVGLQLI